MGYIWPVTSGLVPNKALGHVWASVVRMKGYDWAVDIYWAPTVCGTGLGAGGAAMKITKTPPL